MEESQNPSWMLARRVGPLYKFWVATLAISVITNCFGCSLFPDVRHQPRYHNPFPQIETVAILPFRNQSQEPTLNADRVTLAYYDAVQSLPGFEVLPVGLVKNQLAAFEQQILGRPVSNTEDMQRFASHLGVDAVLQGAVTDYDCYYPPRMTMKVNWYAANPGFHPIPPGYGLPWGTKAERKISQPIRLEAERALAREQIATQTPSAENVLRDGAQNANGMGATSRSEPDSESPISNDSGNDDEQALEIEQDFELMPTPKTALRKSMPEKSPQQSTRRTTTQKNKQEGDEPSAPSAITLASYEANSDELTLLSREAIEAKRITLPNEVAPKSTMNLADQPVSLLVDHESGLVQDSAIELPTKWPDPQGFVPPPPKPTRPVALAQSEPIISHMRSYNGSDGEFTHALSEYYYFRDDGRFGGWEAYLQRSEDFIRFCCHQHLVETLAARGGELKSRTVVRWPLDRYER